MAFLALLGREGICPYFAANLPVLKVAPWFAVATK